MVIDAIPMFPPVNSGGLIEAIRLSVCQLEISTRFRR